MEKLDPNFKKEISSIPSGENIKRCFQCGTCTVSCPVREIDERYNPRKIIRMAILGMKKRVLTSDFIWLCTTCYTCDERCPQDVRIPEVINAIRNLAIKNGYIHSSFLKQAKTIGKTGKLYALSEFEKRRRSRLGLPPLLDEYPEIQKLLGFTWLNELVKVREGG